MLPNGDVAATTKAGTLMILRDGTILHTLLLGEVSSDPKGADSPGNFGGLCYPGSGDVVAMHSGVQTRAMIVNDRLVRPGSKIKDDHLVTVLPEMTVTTTASPFLQ